MQTSDFEESFNEMERAETARAPHTHECRDCGSSIRCSGDGDRCWTGGSDDCEECH